MPRRTALPLAMLTALPLTAVGAVATPARAAALPYTLQHLKVAVKVAPEGALGTTACVIDADLYTPTGAGPTSRVPAILATNGFGGSKADQAGLGKAYATKGYVVLSYSGLGFGSDPSVQGSGSTCKITLDDREHDGAAGSQLIDVLAGRKTATDSDGKPVTINTVQQDTGPAHDGKVHQGDIRVGMVGGSYGGEVQFAVAAVDPRLDTIVPLITWNDLAYSLAPNNTSLPSSTSVTYATAGTEKFDWTTLFFGEGFADGLEGAAATGDPTRLGPCPNFADDACAAKAQMDALGYPDQTTLDFARNASVEKYIGDIHIPTLLGQGQADTLFTVHEATATYAALKERNVPVKMIWQQWGHSHGPLPGEFDLSHPDTNYEGQVITAWFDHYLKDDPQAPALDFSWFRDWVPYTGNAAPAFTNAPSYPLPGTTTLYGSGTSLVASSKGLKAGTATIAAPPNTPLSYTETSALDQSQPVTDAPGATTTLSTPALTHDVDVVGIPTATLRISSPTAAVTQQGPTPAGQLLAFVKLYDVAPDGTVDLPHRVISPIRITDVTKPVQVSLPGIVHRFAKGHTMKLVVSLSDAAYKNNAFPQSLTLSTSQQAPTTLTLPGKLALPTRTATPAASPTATVGPTTTGTATGPTATENTTGPRTPSTQAAGSAGTSGGTLASTGLPAGLPVAATGLLALAWGVRRRRSV